ncbi:Ribonuclease H-like domain containing protein [Canna indica]|uniref:Ribonuclease H-like domain containing protein n=1 Tax=Canna indica TaxID=4628 RepID=A0AAQ3JX10_9LILI|nr:Ribonuclease H-like domain containing protein [Canna indica]
MLSYAFEETMQYGGMVGKNRERSGSSMHNRNRYQEDQEGNCNDGLNVFYCDASWKNGNSARLGYLIAKQGKWVLAGMAKGAADEPMLAEAIAMWYGRDNVRKKGWMNLIVRSDCELLIKMLYGESRPHWKICNLINKISRMKDVGVVCGWEYIKREKNNEAHNLSRLGLTGDECREWNCGDGSIYLVDSLYINQLRALDEVSACGDRPRVYPVKTLTERNKNIGSQGGKYSYLVGGEECTADQSVLALAMGNECLTPPRATRLFIMSLLEPLPIEADNAYKSGDKDNKET